MIKKTKLISLGIILFLLTGFTVWRNINLHIVGGWGILTYISFFQRSTALFTFIVIVFQIILGVYKTRWVKRYGDWVSKLYIFLNVFVYSLILAHVFSYLAFLGIARKIIDPFYIFTDFCILCKTRPELFYSFGRFAFWVFTFVIFFGIIWKKHLLKEKWKIFYYANYLVFFMISVHAGFIGSDMRTLPFLYVFIVSEILFFLIIVQKTFQFFRKNLKLKK